MVRVLPEGRQLQGTAQRDPAGRFGLSQPCVRCLRTLEAFGVQRVIFSTGEQGADGTIGCEIHPVTRLLLSSAHSGHCSRGDEEAIARGALRCQAASWCSPLTRAAPGHDGSRMTRLCPRPLGSSALFRRASTGV